MRRTHWVRPKPVKCVDCVPTVNKINHCYLETLSFVLYIRVVSHLEVLKLKK